MRNNPTRYADVNELLGLLLAQHRLKLGNKLVGLYLFGSLVVGDFDYDISDIDLMAALSSDLNEREFETLQRLHENIVKHYPRWDSRIEIGYIAVENLKTLSSQYTIALISPGEPFHRKEAGTDWIINRSILREKGITLYGPAPETIVAPLSQAQFLHYLQKNIKEWRAWLAQTDAIHQRKYQAFMILTMCRMLYSFKHNGEVVSKSKAAQWAQQELPEWSTLIQNALVWRKAWRDEQVDHDAMFPETLRFVHFMLDTCEGAGSQETPSGPA